MARGASRRVLSLALTLLACALHADAQAGLCKWCPRVVPTWPATYYMPNSTVVMPCNATGLLSPASLTNWSMASIDWSNSKNAWVQGSPMDAELPLLQQAESNAAAFPGMRTWVYRNIVIAYPWFKSVRSEPRARSRAPPPSCRR